MTHGDGLFFDGRCRRGEVSVVGGMMSVRVEGRVVSCLAVVERSQPRVTRVLARQ